MASQKKLVSNRANSQKSTGPATPEGKQISAQNALKHGLYSEHFLLDVENRESYELHHAQLLADYAPQSAVETILIEQLVQAYFLSRRALTAMADLSAGREVSGNNMAAKYPALMRIKNASDRTILRAIEQLRLIARDRAATKSNPPTQPLFEDPATLQKWNPLPDLASFPQIPPSPSAPPSSPPRTY